MTQPQDSHRERIDAIRQVVGNGNFIEPAAVRWLLSRLAALEHERDQAQGACMEWSAIVKREHARAEQAVSALLSLQRAVRDLNEQARRMVMQSLDFDEKRQLFRCRICRNTEGERLHRDGCVVYALHDAFEKADAALLPDPAGTTPPTEDEKTLARVNREQLADHPRTAPTERR